MPRMGRACGPARVAAMALLVATVSVSVNVRSALAAEGAWVTVPTKLASEMRPQEQAPPPSRAVFERGRHVSEGEGADEWVVHQGGGREQGAQEAPRFRERAAAPATAGRSSGAAPPNGFRFAAHKGFFDSVGGLIKDGFNGLVKIISKPQEAAIDLKRLMEHSDIPKDIGGEDIEDCVACQFIWRSIELNMGNTQVVEDLYDELQRQCIDAEKSKIFYPACEVMLDQAEDMIGNYVDGYSVLQVCFKAGLGCDGNYLGTTGGPGK